MLWLSQNVYLHSFLLSFEDFSCTRYPGPTSASSDCDGVDSWYQEMLSSICHALSLGLRAWQRDSRGVRGLASGGCMLIFYEQASRSFPDLCCRLVRTLGTVSRNGSRGTGTYVSRSSEFRA